MEGRVRTPPPSPLTETLPILMDYLGMYPDIAQNDPLSPTTNHDDVQSVRHFLRTQTLVQLKYNYYNNIKFTFAFLTFMVNFFLLC